MYNPAYAGFDGSLSVNTNIRSQWNEIEGNPISQHLNFHLPMYKWNGGVGLALENESLGVWQQTKISVSGNYVREMGQALLSFGVNLGWIQNRLDGLLLRTVDGDYEGVISHNDPILPLSKASSSNYLIDLGLLLSIGQLQVGLSAKNVNEPSFKLNEQDITNARQLRSYFFGVRYNLNINADFQIQPMLLVKSNVKQTQSDVTASVVYRDNFMIGAGMRGYSSGTADAVLILFGVKVSENFWLRYVYDLGISDLANRGDGSHELGLSYNLNKLLGQEIKPKIIYNPRFL